MNTKYNHALQQEVYNQDRFYRNIRRSWIGIRDGFINARVFASQILRLVLL